MQDLTKPHIDSFNYVLKEGLNTAVKRIEPLEFALPSGQRISLSIQNASILNPMVPQSNIYATTLRVFPAECRERGITYKGKLTLELNWSVDGRKFGPVERAIGDVPIMVKSNACNIVKMNPAELVQHGEEIQEMGGYFIVNGNEKVLRMLIMPRRNYPMALSRGSWKSRGPQYTEFGVQMRTVADDQTSTNLVLHYLNDGNAMLCFVLERQQFFVPLAVMLRALVDQPDHFIYSELVKGREDNSYYKGCIASMLRQMQEEGLSTRAKTLQYLGKTFRVKLGLPDWYTDLQVGEFLIRSCICIHLKDNVDKFNTLVFMTQKLYALTKHGCAAESADNPMFQEALVAGHLYLMVLKDRLKTWLQSLKSVILKKVSMGKGVDMLTNPTSFCECMRMTQDVTKAMEFLLATGNLATKSTLGLMQMKGLAVLADKLNFYRYISHFRCIHRGAFFSEMRTTAVRRLLPEAYGFICPVHTPDGSPCGLLNHLTAECQVSCAPPSNLSSQLPQLLSSLGMLPMDAPLTAASEYYNVLLDGKVLGRIHQDSVSNVADRLRALKVTGGNPPQVSPLLEIGLVMRTPQASQYPGLFLFSSCARFIRPVTNLLHDKREMVGSFEQVYMDICVTASEAIPGVTTHQDLCETSMLSTLANFTPFSDFNQSPRNMYQCQMGKQTMGTPLHALVHRADNKLYRIQTPQSPMVRPKVYDDYDVDEYPNGTNAIVAVISYTGYDMEDAMIINKSSYERGFAHGSVYKSEVFILLLQFFTLSCHSGVKPGDTLAEQHLDADGLPFIGRYLTSGSPYYSYINVQTGESRVVKYKYDEPAYVQQIKLLAHDLSNTELQKVCIVLRIRRNPIIGDKFSSRHGQKGICSQKWPVENMPFTEGGITPDILFNPHGFPSRMTIGMMIESMAGKSAAAHGICHDATPFTFSEKQPAIEFFGDMLTEAGYNYYGTERLYSGVNGKLFEADIFTGVVYYQRLRHMVSDKFQVRSTGAVDVTTHQPIKGRKRGGGIRFGEMERDALIAHGASFLLNDRLFNCSDRSLAHVCVKCGSLLSPLIQVQKGKKYGVQFESSQAWKCCVCQSKDSVKVIAVPYVLRYLVAELAAMNIKTNLDIRDSLS
uniref:DNA-directed RNA polymerase subunit beta n=1 Tax=Capitella teleta TaxID=283909 RepID=X1YWB5_CAPTE